MSREPLRIEERHAICPWAGPRDGQQARCVGERVMYVPELRSREPSGSRIVMPCVPEPGLALSSRLAASGSAHMSYVSELEPRSDQEAFEVSKLGVGFER